MKESRYSKFIKKRILLYCVLLLIVCISFGVSYSNFVINGTEQRAVEMFAGGLKYTMSLNNTAANSILVEPGTTTATIDVTSSSSVSYKYILTNSINENIEVISYSDDASGTIEPNESKSIEVEITNNSENNINISFELASGYTTNEISDIEFKAGFAGVNTISSTTSYLDIAKFQTFVTNNSPTEIYFTITGHSTGTDISSDQNEPIYAWMEGTKMYISAVEANKKVSAPENSAFLFYVLNGTNPFVNISKIDASYLDTSKVTNMASMFYKTGYDSESFDLNISTWNTSKVINMSYMFSYSGYNANNWSVGDLNSWDTSKVIIMLGMFEYAGHEATTINIDLSTWNTSNSTDMYAMFDEFAYNVTTFDLDLSGWDTSKVTTMFCMFNKAGHNATTWSLKNINNWNVTNVTDMSMMFLRAGYSATTFELDLSGWYTTSVTDMSMMFLRAGYVATTFDLDLSNWNTSQTTDMDSMFADAGRDATTFEIKIPSRSNGTSDNTTSNFYGLSTSTTPSSGRTFTLVN